MQNCTLEELMIEANPLSVDFAKSLCSALQVNTALKRLGFLQSYRGFTIPPLLDAEIRYCVALNEAGRGLLRAASIDRERHCVLAALPLIFCQIRNEPSSLYGLLRENISLWTDPCCR
jgi:hypothetical protein